MTIDETIGMIRIATSSGDWLKVQPLVAELRRMMVDDGRSLNGQHAARLIDALAGSPQLAAAPALAPRITDVAKQICQLASNNSIDTKAMHATWDTFYQMLADPGQEVTSQDLRSVLGSLKTARAFGLLTKTADRALAHIPDDPHCWRLYAQALIDDGQSFAAIEVLQRALLIDVNNHTERDELHGLLGRAYKQIYVDHVTARTTPASVRAKFKPMLEKAIEAYGRAYNPSVPDRNYWHGVNIAALLWLAQADGQANIPAPNGIASEDLCKLLIAALTQHVDNADDPWMLATLAECYLMLGETDNSLRFFSRYLQHPLLDHFMLFSTVRQLENVLRIAPGDGPGGKVLAVLKERQILMEEGKFLLDGDALQQLGKIAGTPEHRRLSETIVPGGAYVKLNLLQTVVSRATAIAALCNPAGVTQGTGFIVRGSDLKADWGNDLYLVTNAHVLSDPTRQDFEDSAPLRPDTVRIVMEACGGARVECERRVRWQSSINGHDTAILRVVSGLPDIKPIPICAPDMRLQPGDPDDEKRRTTASKVSVIGYPLGGPLSLSVVGSISGANGLLVDLGARNSQGGDPTYLHYRAPTEPGNSGSPVFETETWGLVGLHHEGFDRFEGRPRLEGKSGRTFANEGISINSIRRELTRVRA